MSPARSVSMSQFQPAGAPPAMTSLRTALLLLVSLFAFTGCAPAIGDGCNNSTDCSVNGDRICDIAQPGGYCTVRGCDPDTCPDNSVCVAFRFEPARTAESWCMDRCKSDGACRQSAGYRCVGADDERLLEGEEMLAQVIDREGDGAEGQFCAAVATPD